MSDTVPATAKEIAKYKRDFRSTAQQNPEISELVANNNTFAVNLYQSLHDSPGNLFNSPFSISTSLSMTYAGARNETAQQMKQTLCFGLPDKKLHGAFHVLNEKLTNRSKRSADSGFRLHIANALWMQKGLKVTAGFNEILRDNYGSSLEYIDFKGSPEKSSGEINSWVSKQTGHKIEKIVSPQMLKSDTKLVLANAIYFNAEWQVPFVSASTQENDFFLPDGSSVSVPMMAKTGEVGYTGGTHYQALEKPYKGNMSMVVVLPHSGFFEEIDRSLTPEKLNEIIDSFSWRTVSLKLPKFEFESAPVNLSTTLSSMGMPNAFSPAADFSGIAPGIFISDVFHKATITVTEEGTEAAAVTIVAMPTGIPTQKPIDFTVNRPFIFLIRDTETGTTLFMGRIINPQVQG
nr:serpin family protein [uncultured Sulfurimonas sp.]